MTLIEWFSLNIQNVNGVKTPSLFIDFAIGIFLNQILSVVLRLDDREYYL